MPETTPDALVAYLWEHGERYSPRVLRDHLVAHGFDPVQIDQAVAAYQAERAQLGIETPPPPPRRGWSLGLSLGAFLLGAPVALANLAFLAYEFLFGLQNAGAFPTQASARIGDGFRVWLTILATEVVVGLVLSLVAWLPGEGPSGWRAVGRLVGGGLLLAVLLTGAFFLVVGGICAAMLAGPR
jgi:hypothetical protein